VFQRHTDGIVVTVTGVFVWAIFDNFEWFSGSHTKFGLQYLNETSLGRYHKLSFFQFLDSFKQKGGVALAGSSIAGGNASQIPGKQSTRNAA
jgi:beta-glucosidase/6-phospho-beta-glucosidase/beta-galactosidase